MQVGQGLRDFLARSFSKPGESVEIRLEDISRVKQRLRIESEKMIEEEDVVARVKEYLASKGCGIENLVEEGSCFKAFMRGVRKGAIHYLVVTIDVAGEDWAVLKETHLSLITINGQLP